MGNLLSCGKFANRRALAQEEAERGEAVGAAPGERGGGRVEHEAARGGSSPFIAGTTNAGLRKSLLDKLKETRPERLEAPATLSVLQHKLPFAVRTDDPARVRVFPARQIGAPTIRIKPATFKTLALARKVIWEVRNDPAVRIGNQLSGVVATKGESAAALTMLRHWLCAHYGEVIDNRIRAEAALRFRAFDCSMLSALAMVRLVEAGCELPVACVTSKDHIFLLIGDPANPDNSEEDIVVLDAWATYPVAHTLATARLRFPVRKPDETQNRYLARCEAGSWQHMQSWYPGRDDFLKGYDFSAAPKGRNHDGKRFEDMGDTPTANSPDDEECALWEQDSLSDLRIDVAEEEREEAEPASPVVCGEFPDVEGFLRAQGVTDDVLKDILADRPGSPFPQIHEWQFSTDHPDAQYTCKDGSRDEAGPVTFNDIPIASWNRQQEVLAGIYADKGILSAIRPGRILFDLPRPE